MTPKEIGDYVQELTVVQRSWSMEGLDGRIHEGQSLRGTAMRRLMASARVGILRRIGSSLLPGACRRRRRYAT